MLAAVFLTAMIFWMQRQGRQIRAELEADVRRASAGSAGGWALFAVAFLAVVREGIELALRAGSSSVTAAPNQPFSYPEFLGRVFMRNRWMVTATATTASSTRTQIRSTAIRAV